MNKPVRLLLATLLFLPPAAPAVQTERILIDHFQDWAEGRPGGLAILEPGYLTPAPAFHQMADWETSVIWSGAAEPGGSVLIAAGKPGSVWRMKPDGKLDKLTEFNEPDVYAVAAGPKGAVYAAPSPGGKIFRPGPKGSFEEYYQTGEEYIWDLKVSPSGVLFAATGPKGRIHRITAKGVGQVWFDAGEPHIRRLAFDAEGNLLAGTSDKGLLYRITGHNQGVVLLDPGRDEIAGMAVTADGDIVVAANSGSGGGGSSDRPRTPRATAAPEGSPAGASAPLVEVVREPARTSSSSQPKGSTDIYVLKRNLFPSKIREIKDDIVSLAAVGNTVYGASAADGRLYQITGGSAFGVMGEIEGKSVVGLLAQGSSIFALTQGQSQIWRAGTTPVPEGSYTSRVLDSKGFSRWGALAVSGEGEWTVRTRSGNTSDADKSWHPWIALDRGKVASPAARYLQFQIRLNRGKIEQAEVFFLPQNQPPKIELLRVLAPDTAFEPLPQPQPPPQPQSAEQLAKGAEGMNLPPARFQPSMARGARSVAWQASDPNGDLLQFSLYLRKEGESRWELLDDKIDQSVYSWDSSGWPDAGYRVRLVARDTPGNSGDSALETEKISEAFTIDHTAPAAVIKRKTARDAEIEVTDRTSRIEGAYVSYNGYNFTPVLPEDGLIDSHCETYRIPRKEGRTLYFRAGDEHGNVVGVRVTPD